MGTRMSYLDEHQRLEGYLAARDSARPGVLIVPSWLNVTESICRRADRLADAGYDRPETASQCHDAKC